MKALARKVRPVLGSFIYHHVDFTLRWFHMDTAPSFLLVEASCADEADISAACNAHCLETCCSACSGLELCGISLVVLVDIKVVCDI